MKSNKKGDLSLTTVVVAAVSLLVLIVLTVIFAQRMGIFGDGLRHCDTICTESTQQCQDAGYDLAAYYGNCKDVQGNQIKENAYCCKGPQETS
ncbi:hypothetical protein H6503_01740 [Candidatus Woesearchaeota archaeon]|nr:hypothetical protein [Candidatus Woesearchaeota archaeon]